MNSHYSVIIVEDEALWAMCIEMRLRRAGFDVKAIAATGLEAIKESRKHHPDAILLDIRLGGDVDGITAAKIIKKTEKTDVIFMTGYLDPEIRAAAGMLAPVAYLVKPFDISELIGILINLQKVDRPH